MEISMPLSKKGQKAGCVNQRKTLSEEHAFVGQGLPSVKKRPKGGSQLMPVDKRQEQKSYSSYVNQRKTLSEERVPITQRKPS
jgi:hypothetical protein